MAVGAPARQWASPLQELERSTQELAKEARLDMSQPGAVDRLREMVGEQIALWRAEFRQGLREVDIADPDKAQERIMRNLVGYGPIQGLIEDPDVWEIMINSPSAIFVKRHSGANGYHHESFYDDDHLSRVLMRILDESGTSHRKLDPTAGLQDAQLVGGSRLHIVHADIGRDGHMLVNIRKFSGVASRSLAELIARQTLDLPTANYLKAAVRSGLSVLIAGPPGSGKTTLLSCLAAELDPGLRVVVAEEVFETDVALANVAHMQTRPERVDRKAVDLRRLVSGFLRMAPDVAIVGEVRDREALPLLLTLSSGVQGFTTIHAGSARQALSRLRFICQLSEAGSQLSVGALSSLVSDSVDLVVQCMRQGPDVRVTEVMAVEDLQGAPGTPTFTTTSVFLRHRFCDALAWTGNLPVRASRAMELAGFEPLALLAGRGQR